MNENKNSSRDLPLANLGRRVTWNRKPQAAVCRSQQIDQTSILRSLIIPNDGSTFWGFFPCQTDELLNYTL